MQYEVNMGKKQTLDIDAESSRVKLDIRTFFVIGFFLVSATASAVAWALNKASEYAPAAAAEQNSKEIADLQKDTNDLKKEAQAIKRNTEAISGVERDIAVIGVKLDFMIETRAQQARRAGSREWREMKQAAKKAKKRAAAAGADNPLEGVDVLQ